MEVSLSGSDFCLNGPVKLDRADSEEEMDEWRIIGTPR